MEFLGYITWDTNFIIDIGYDFDFVLFRVLKNKNYKFIVSSIVDREIKKHLKKESENISTTIKKFGALRNINGYKSIYKKNIIDDSESSYEFFKNELNVEIVDLSEVDSNKIFDDYFAGNGAFGKGDKKNEFPDAYAIESIKKKVIDSPIFVLSNDHDWEKAFNHNPNATILKNKSEAVKYFCPKEAISDALKRYIYAGSNAEKIINMAEKEFESNASSLNYPDETYELQDYDFNVDEESFDPVVLEEKDNCISAYIYFKYDFSVNFTYENLDESSYDKEEGIIYNISLMDGYIKGSEEGYIQVTFIYSSEKCNVRQKSIEGIELNLFETPEKYFFKSEFAKYVDEGW